MKLLVVTLFTFSAFIAFRVKPVIAITIFITKVRVNKAAAFTLPWIGKATPAPTLTAITVTNLVLVDTFATYINMFVSHNGNCGKVGVIVGDCGKVGVIAGDCGKVGVIIGVAAEKCVPPGNTSCISWSLFGASGGVGGSHFLRCSGHL